MSARSQVGVKKTVLILLFYQSSLFYVFFLLTLFFFFTLSLKSDYFMCLHRQNQVDLFLAQLNVYVAM